MTEYALDPARHALVAVWSPGLGNVAETVATVPGAVADDQGFRLAEALTILSRVLWRTYTHPASAADSLEINTEGWRRQLERDAFTEVVPAIRKPNLPQGGMLVQSYNPVEESAHQVGRVLHEIAEPDLLDRVVTDVAAELAAIELAERGELSGRARQAVRLTRADASPAQVAAADALLAQEPLGCARLFSEVDPVAASVAATHWLQAAAEVAAEAAGTSPTQVVAEADDIEAFAVPTPTLVLEAMAEGESPRDVVTSLITEAMEAAEGRIPDAAALVEEIVDAEQQAQGFGDRADEVRQALMPDRVTPLDPARPAHDLLEDLLDGIRGCWLLYREYADARRDGKLDAEPAEDEEAEAERRENRLRETFFDAVRAEAATHRDRLV